MYGITPMHCALPTNILCNYNMTESIHVNCTLYVDVWIVYIVYCTVGGGCGLLDGCRTIWGSSFKLMKLHVHVHVHCYCSCTGTDRGWSVLGEAGMCIYMYMYMYMYIHVCTCTCIYFTVQTLSHTYTVYIHVHVHVQYTHHVRIYMYILYMYMYVHSSILL